LTHLISEQKPHVVLLGGTSIGSDVAGALSARLGLPLVSSCYSATSDGTLTSMICGGKIVAETGLPETSTLITMIPGAYKPQDGQGEKPPQVVVVAVPALDGLRVTLKGYIEPEAGDVDIAREPVLIAVGRGIQRNENLELAEALAQAIGGVVCASRPVVDQGWLPTSRLVGKSGKRVKAKLYLAIGISGAPEHVEGLGDTEMIIAVNTDPTAPIFNVAKYGTTADLFDLVPVLTEKVREARVAEVRG
jgi:electron transfer flavoprotein alpha subunit